MPSIMSKEVLQKFEKICKDFLRKISFKSSFANIELWINKTHPEDIHIIQVNPHSAFSNHEQYRTSYLGSDLYDSIIDG